MYNTDFLGVQPSQGLGLGTKIKIPSLAEKKLELLAQRKQEKLDTVAPEPVEVPVNPWMESLGQSTPSSDIANSMKGLTAGTGALAADFLQTPLKVAEWGMQAVDATDNSLYTGVKDVNKWIDTELSAEEFDRYFGYDDTAEKQHAAKIIQAGRNIKSFGDAANWAMEYIPNLKTLDLFVQSLPEMVGTMRNPKTMVAVMTDKINQEFEEENGRESTTSEKLEMAAMAVPYVYMERMMAKATMLRGTKAGNELGRMLTDLNAQSKKIANKLKLNPNSIQKTAQGLITEPAKTTAKGALKSTVNTGIGAARFGTMYAGKTALEGVTEGAQGALEEIGKQGGLNFFNEEAIGEGVDWEKVKNAAIDEGLVGTAVGGQMVAVGDVAEKPKAIVKAGAELVNELGKSGKESLIRARLKVMPEEDIAKIEEALKAEEEQMTTQLNWLDSQKAKAEKAETIQDLRDLKDEGINRIINDTIGEEPTTQTVTTEKTVELNRDTVEEIVANPEIYPAINKALQGFADQYTQGDVGQYLDIMLQEGNEANFDKFTAQLAEQGIVDTVQVSEEVADGKSTRMLNPEQFKVLKDTIVDTFEGAKKKQIESFNQARQDNMTALALSNIKEETKTGAKKAAKKSAEFAKAAAKKLNIKIPDIDFTKPIEAAKQSGRLLKSIGNYTAQETAQTVKDIVDSDGWGSDIYNAIRGMSDKDLDQLKKDFKDNPKVIKAVEQVIRKRNSARRTISVGAKRTVRKLRKGGFLDTVEDLDVKDPENAKMLVSEIKDTLNGDIRDREVFVKIRKGLSALNKAGTDIINSEEIKALNTKFHNAFKAFKETPEYSQPTTEEVQEPTPEKKKKKKKKKKQKEDKITDTEPTATEEELDLSETANQEIYGEGTKKAVSDEAVEAFTEEFGIKPCK